MTVIESHRWDEEEGWPGGPKHWIDIATCSECGAVAESNDNHVSPHDGPSSMHLARERMFARCKCAVLAALEPDRELLTNSP